MPGSDSSILGSHGASTEWQLVGVIFVYVCTSVCAQPCWLVEVVHVIVHVIVVLFVVDVMLLQASLSA